jgi:hypothetical protein
MPFTPWIRPKNTKGASLEAAPWFPSEIFSLYIYFISLEQVKWTFWQVSICFAGNGMGRKGCFGGIDKI